MSPRPFDKTQSYEETKARSANSGKRITQAVYIHSTKADRKAPLAGEAMPVSDTTTTATYSKNAATDNAFQLNGTYGTVEQKQGQIYYTENTAGGSSKQVNGDAEALIGQLGINPASKNPKRDS